MAADNRSVKEAREDAERRKRAKISGPARKAAKAEKSKKEPEMAGDHRSVKGLEAAIKKEMKTIRRRAVPLTEWEQKDATPKEKMMIEKYGLGLTSLLRKDIEARKNPSPTTRLAYLKTTPEAKDTQEEGYRKYEARRKLEDKYPDYKWNRPGHGR